MSWTGKNNLKTLRVDADFFENGGKKNIFKNIRIRVDRQLNDLKTLRVDSDFFENGRKKARFLKISGYVWTGPLFIFHQKQEVESLRDVLPF